MNSYVKETSKLTYDEVCEQAETHEVRNYVKVRLKPWLKNQLLTIEDTHAIINYLNTCTGDIHHISVWTIKRYILSK